MAIIHVHGSSIFFYVFLLIIPITNSISESEALLKLKESFTNTNGLDSWKPGTEPCGAPTGNNDWFGVKCISGVITSLNVEHLGLSGKIDVDALASMSGLRSITFASNAFSGPIPDFSPLANLRGLYLSRNQFSGVIPSDYFLKMKGLRKVWLSRNAFSGPIPSSLAQVSHLIELHLDNNRFSGPIPPLGQRSLISLNLSNNNLEGEIPSGLTRFGQDYFLGNPELCGGNLDRACRKSPLSSRQVKIIICSLFASLLVLFVLLALGIYVLKRRQDRDSDQPVNDFEPSVGVSSDGKTILESGQRGFGSGHRTGSGHRSGSGRKGSGRFGKGDIVMIHDDKGVFGLSDLMKAAAEVLGNGALGSSYKATMACGLTVVVKRIKGVAKMGKDQFDTEMRKLGCLKHKNVLAPMAYHYTKDEKLLVCEYQPMGSLLLVLHGDRGITHAHLTWPVRLKIIQGIARGLAYIHAQLSLLDLPHGNLKSSNVLLSDEYEPLLSDFGLSPLITPAHATNALSAYKSPDAVSDTNDVTPKCDVYCLGVVILEILTGKFPSRYLNNGEGGTDVVQWVRSAIAEGKEGDVFDPDIECNKGCIDEMEQMLRIGADCTEDDRSKRLDVNEAVRRIEGVGKDGDRVQDTRTVRFRTVSGGLYGTGGDESEEEEVRERA